MTRFAVHGDADRESGGVGRCRAAWTAFRGGPFMDRLFRHKLHKIYDESASYIYGGSGGNGFCDGYGAGCPGRDDTSIGTEYTFKMLENEVETGTAVCESVDANTYTNTDWRKRISVALGVTVYFAYLPNGHIVKDKKAIGTQHGSTGRLK